MITVCIVKCLHNDYNLYFYGIHSVSEFALKFRFDDTLLWHFSVCLFYVRDLKWTISREINIIGMKPYSNSARASHWKIEVKELLDAIYGHHWTT